MFKEIALKGLESIIQNTCNAAVAFTAEHYYDTVENMSEKDFQKVASFYEEFINKYEPKLNK